MSRRLHFSAGFSLVEVTLALGVAAFCLMALSGLLPLGLHVNQSSISETAAASVLSSVIADLDATPKTSLTSPLYTITFGTAKVLYFDGNGSVVTPLDQSATPRYRLAVTFPSGPVAALGPTFVSLKLTWPALADPAITRPAGVVETLAAFDRH